ncbi:MAG: translation initiation factor [Muribaculaceae bacterium]|nr:translation initiation factor [Muribaculaceae bacterium]
MNEDWKAKLMGLQDSLPQGESSEESPAEEIKGKSATLNIFFEKKGRGGKQATIITGFQCGDDELKTIAATIKQKLGTGGSARGGEILIQGDRRKELPALLQGMGFKTK